MIYLYVLAVIGFIAFAFATVTLAGYAKFKLRKSPKLAEAISTALFIATAAVGVGTGFWIQDAYRASHGASRLETAK